MVQSKGVKSKIESETTQHPSVLASSNKVNRGTSIPVLKEKSEVDEELLDLAQKIMENLPMEEIPSTSTQPMTEEINSSNVYEEKYEEKKENEEKAGKEIYPIGDMRRLTPLERAHYRRLQKEILALDEEKRAWVDLQMPLEERLAKEKAHFERVRKVGGQIIYYLKKLGYKPPPPFEEWPGIVDPYTEGDLVGVEEETEGFPNLPEGW